MKKGFIFDLDGVLTDTAEFHYEAWSWLAESVGITIDRMFNEELKGVSREESLEKILHLGGKEDLNEREKRQLAAQKNTRYVALLENLTPDSLLPGVADFLQAARNRQIPCVLASASKNAHYILNKLAIDEYFIGIVDPSTLSKGKPHPEIFLKAVELLGLAPEETIGFEDAIAGIAGLKAAGIYAVGIISNEELPRADLCVTSFSKLDIDELLKK